MEVCSWFLRTGNPIFEDLLGSDVMDTVGGEELGVFSWCLLCPLFTLFFHLWWRSWGLGFQFPCPLLAAPVFYHLEFMSHCPAENGCSVPLYIWQLSEAGTAKLHDSCSQFKSVPRRKWTMQSVTEQVCQVTFLACVLRTTSWFWPLLAPK